MLCVRSNLSRSLVFTPRDVSCVVTLSSSVLYLFLYGVKGSVTAWFNASVQLFHGSRLVWRPTLVRYSFVTYLEYTVFSVCR